jgi:hypothetical protein
MRSFLVIFVFGLFLISCAEKKDSTTETVLSADKKDNADEKKSAINEETKKKVEEYFKSHDTAYVAQDAVFINMSTGEVTKGRAAIAGMLHHIYHEAFDARADIKHTLITDEHAVLEANFIGKRERAPLCNI